MYNIDLHTYSGSISSCWTSRSRSSNPTGRARRSRSSRGPIRSSFPNSSCWSFCARRTLISFFTRCTRAASFTHRPYWTRSALQNKSTVLATQKNPDHRPKYLYCGIIHVSRVFIIIYRLLTRWTLSIGVLSGKFV